MKNETKVERVSEREVVITRTFDAPAQLVFEAWTKPEIMRRWWVPRSMGMTLLACEMDVRSGGTYRFVFPHPSGAEPMAFFGRYLEVTPHSRLVWTNEEDPTGGRPSSTPGLSRQRAPSDKPARWPAPGREGRASAAAVSHGSSPWCR